MTYIKMEQYCVGAVGTNCYFIVNAETKDIIIVDPGAQASKLSDIIHKSSYKPRAILLTHGHFDHVLAADVLSKTYGIEIYAHEAEKETLEQPKLNVSGMTGNSVPFHADIFVKDQEILDIAGFKIKVLFTPGHTVGGCCYYIEENGVLMSGDTLFAGSVGRSDFPGGDGDTLIQSIKEQLLVLPDNVKVYPGHMETTTIEREREHNPFLV